VLDLDVLSLRRGGDWLDSLAWLVMGQLAI
jgi:hypothetical protein